MVKLFNKHFNQVFIKTEDIYQRFIFQIFKQKPEPSFILTVKMIKKYLYMLVNMYVYTLKLPKIICSEIYWTNGTLFV